MTNDKDTMQPSSIREISALMRGRIPRKGVGRVLEFIGNTITALLFVVTLPPLILLKIPDLILKPLCGLSLMPAAEGAMVKCLETVVAIFNRYYPEEMAPQRRRYPCQTILMTGENVAGDFTHDDGGPPRG